MRKLRSALETIQFLNEQINLGLNKRVQSKFNEKDGMYEVGAYIMFEDLDKYLKKELNSQKRQRKGNLNRISINISNISYGKIPHRNQCYRISFSRVIFGKGPHADIDIRDNNGLAEIFRILVGTHHTRSTYDLIGDYGKDGYYFNDKCKKVTLEDIETIKNLMTLFFDGKFGEFHHMLTSYFSAI